MAVLAATGCVRRRLTVRSNPPGAVVYVDNQRIGTTPCSVDYVYYGTREIRLSMQGFETLTVNQPLPAPWYEYPVLDLVAEHLVPVTINDARTVSFNLRRERLAPAEEVIARGQQLRQQATPTGLAPVVPTAGVVPLGQPAAPPVAAFSPAPVVTPIPAVASPLPAAPSEPVLLESVPFGAPGLPDTFRY